MEKVKKDGSWCNAVGIEKNYIGDASKVTDCPIDFTSISLGAAKYKGDDCPVLPKDNTFDLTFITKRMEEKAEELMKRMTEHFEKLVGSNPDWINVDMRVPPNDCLVLLAIYDSRPKVEMFFLAMGYRINHAWFYGHDGSETGRVTHWMPLPDKPKKEDI